MKSYKRKPKFEYPFKKGDKLDKLTILEDDFVFHQDRYMVKCLCDCGNIDYRRLSELQKMPFKCCKHCCSKILYPEQRKQRGLFDENGINYSWFNHLKSSDNLKRGGKLILFDLTMQDLYDVLVKQNFKCAYTGEPLNVLNTFKYDSNASLDRIDSEKGYTKDNIQWVTKVVNVMKNDIPHNLFLELCTKIHNYAR